MARRSQSFEKAMLLGLSEQVPAEVVFLTDGSSHVVRVGAMTLQLRRTTPRDMAATGRPSGLVVRAFRRLGLEHITPERIARLRRTLPADDRRALLKELTLAPEWMHRLLKELAVGRLLLPRWVGDLGLNGAEPPRSHRWPQISPDGKVLFFTVWTGPGWDEKRFEAQLVDGGERRRLVQGASTGRYLSTGHLLYARNEELFVVPFELARVRVTGPPVTLVDRASEQADAGEGAQITASDSGTLAYVRSDARASDRRMVWVGADRSVQPLSSPPGAYTDPAISPDGRSVAVSIQGPLQHLWIYDLARSTLTILPSPGSSQAPTWTPDGHRLVYRRTLGGYRDIFWRAADGSGDEERLTTTDALQAPSTVSKDGASVFFDEVSPETGRDMWMLRLDAERRRQPVLNTRFNEWSARLPKLLAVHSFEVLGIRTALAEWNTRSSRCGAGRGRGAQAPGRGDRHADTRTFGNGVVLLGTNDSGPRQTSLRSFTWNIGGSHVEGPVRSNPYINSASCPLPTSVAMPRADSFRMRTWAEMHGDCAAAAVGAPSIGERVV